MTSPSTDRLTGCRWRERERTQLRHVRGLHEFVNRHACTNPPLVMTRLQEFSDVNPPLPPSPSYVYAKRPLPSFLFPCCMRSRRKPREGSLPFAESVISVAISPR